MRKFEMMDDFGTYSKPKSISNTLIKWFLILGLSPLILVSLFSYHQVSRSLVQVAEEELQESSELSSRFIESWFEYRLMDLRIQSESLVNAHLLDQLTKGFKQSNQPLSEYVKSHDWATRVDDSEINLATMVRAYDYIYDLLLIDNEGNILYTLAKESELGTNLNNGLYSQTKFSEAFNKSNNTEKILFSGLERYSPSNNIIAGFTTAPILNESGEKIGVFASQLRLDRIFSLLMSKTSLDASLRHYLVDKNGLLLSPLSQKGEDEVLRRIVDTEQFNPEIQGKKNNNERTIVEYDGPSGKRVFGISEAVRLKGVEWNLITEIDRDAIMSLPDSMKRTMIFLSLTLSLLLICLAIYLAKRITQPIKELEEISMKVAAGDINQHVEVRENDEIGRLSVSFNHMLKMREMHEKSLGQRSQESQKALSALADQKYALDQHAIVAITDRGGTITFINEKFSELSGYSKEELIGQNHRILNSGFHSSEFFTDMYVAISSGKVWQAEICNKTKEGDLYWVDTTIVPFMGNDGPESYIAIRTDVTERRKTEDDLIEARIEAEMAVIAKGEFLASMSHEIRTPMNGVLGMLGLLLNTNLNNEQKHRAKIAQSSAESLLTLINDILDLSKVEAGKLELEMIDFKLHDMLGGFAEAMALQAQNKDVELVLDLTAVDQTMVKGDPSRLRQILTNLVGNAIKFTDDGEIVIRAELREASDSDWRLIVSVTDTGIGIPEDKLELLFESFSQVDASTTREYGGTGLGLSIVKKLSALMGGGITVISQEGVGSCFELSVVFKKSVGSHQVVPNVDMKSLNLLVVDDNKTNRDVLRGQFESWGASVIEAESGQQALEICDERAQQSDIDFFDIALLDMKMPVMNGAELGQALKSDQRYSGMKLVMMTSIGCQGDAQRYADIGFSAYFPKPATTSDLFDALAVIVEGGEALENAQPLVTGDYLKSLGRDDFIDEHRFESTIGRTEWPKNSLILLVEDNQINQMVATGLLKAFGLEVTVANNGVEALEILRDDNRHYCLVLMDCEMPQMDGYEASQRIRAAGSGILYEAIPIVAMTANVMQGNREKCMDAGMNDYLAKPINPELLLDKLKEWILKRPSHVQEATNNNVTEDNKLAVWDEKTALKRVMGDSVLISTVLDVFIKESPERIRCLLAALESNDCELVRQLAHSLKGVAGNLAGVCLEHKAMQMEAFAKEADIEKLQRLMPELQHAHEELLSCFKQHQAKSITDDIELDLASKWNVEELIHLLRNLELKLNNSEYVEPKELESLKQFSLSLQTENLIGQLISQINQFDNKSAMETLRAIEATEGVELQIEL